MSELACLITAAEPFTKLQNSVMRYQKYEQQKYISTLTYVGTARSKQNQKSIRLFIGSQAYMRCDRQTDTILSGRTQLTHIHTHTYRRTHATAANSAAALTLPPEASLALQKNR